MEKIFANCDNCGNAIEITEAVRYVTCNRCKQALAIVRTSTSIYTQRNGASDSAASSGNKPEIDRMEIHRQIELLDRKWNNEIPNFMVKGTLPDTAVFLDYFLGIVVIGFGIVWAVVASHEAGPLSFVGFFFIGLGLWNLISQHNRRRKFLEMKEKYERERSELTNKLE